MRALITIVSMLLAGSASAQIFRSPSGGGASVPGGAIFSERTTCAAKGNFGASGFFGFGCATANQGSAAIVARTSDVYGRYSRSRRGGAASAVVEATANCGSVTGNPCEPRFGYTTSFKFGIPAGYALGYRAVIGVIPAGTTIASGMTPETFTSSIYFGFASTEATWQICTQDAAASRTCVDTGLAIGSTGMYMVTFSTEDGTSYDYSVKRLDVPAEIISGTATSTLPAVTLASGFKFVMGIANPAVGVIIEPAMTLYTLGY